MANIQSNFHEIPIQGQQNTANFGFAHSYSFPLALQANKEWKPTLEEAISHIKHLSQTGELLNLTQQHGGAILLRGLPITSPDDYSRVAHAFGFAAHEEVGRPPIRTVLAPNVKTANEGPPELPIWPHNEYGWSTHHPAWLTFACLDVAETGGATPLISSVGLASRLKRDAPQFFGHLLEKGVKYVYRYGRKQVESTTGASIFAAYGQHVKDGDEEETIKRKVEDEVRRHSNDFEWHDDGSLSVTHVVPIIRKHIDSGLTTWFGNLTSAYGRARHHGATLPPFRGDDGSYHPPPIYGDGTPIATEDLELALSIAEDMQVDVYWQSGDVVLLDNLAVMHSRRPWTGKRTVLAALWDDVGEKRISDYEEGKKLLEGRSNVSER